MNVIILSPHEFNDLLDYSLSEPTDTTIGKQWKMKHDSLWYLCEYVESKKLNAVGISRKAILIDEKSGKCCLTCKRKELTLDQLDQLHIDEKPGKRMLFDCSARLPPAKRPSPIMLTVVERESNPDMQVDTSFMATFWCCHYESDIGS